MKEAKQEIQKVMVKKILFDCPHCGNDYEQTPTEFEPNTEFVCFECEQLFIVTMD